MKNFKKLIAIGASAAMLLGSAIPAFAGSGDGTTGGATGEGTSTGHLDKSYIEAAVPTQETINALFTFYVDPEDIFGQGGKLSDRAVTKVDDLVYFPTTTAGTYAATSQDLEIEVKNFVDAKVTVTASVDTETAGLITLLGTDTINNSAAADAAALYLTLNVGDETPVAITSEGATAEETVDGQDDKFEITGTVGSYAATPKSDATGWEKVAVSLTGKAQLVEDATGIVAPKVTLAYEITLPSINTAPSIAKTTYTKEELATASYVIEANFGTGESAATKIEKVWVSSDNSTFKAFSGENVPTINGNKVTLKSAWVSSLTSKRYIKVFFDNGDPIVVTIDQ